MTDLNRARDDAKHAIEGAVIGRPWRTVAIIVALAGLPAFAVAAI